MADEQPHPLGYDNTLLSLQRDAYTVAMALLETEYYHATTAALKTLEHCCLRVLRSRRATDDDDVAIEMLRADLGRSRMHGWPDGSLDQWRKFRGLLDRHPGAADAMERTAARLRLEAAGEIPAANCDEGADWLTVKLAAARFGLSQAIVSRAATAGEFKTNGKRGPDRRIEPDSFDAWYARRKQRMNDRNR
jgi:hypothetical protein